MRCSASTNSIRAGSEAYKSTASPSSLSGDPTARFELCATSVHEYAFGETFVARCSWHGYEYDVESGECIADRRWRVKTYPVTIEHGKVMVERR
jgi:hypothetical protein